MTDFPSYAYGTVTIDAAGTVITGTDTIWSGVNARAGDDITIDGHTVIIVDVTDETHLVIDAWPYDAVTDAEYKITQRSPLRFVGGIARADLTQLLSTLKAKGLLWYLPEEYDEPDDAKPPLTADDDQGILRISTGELWVMQGGSWVSAGTFKGVNPRGAWVAGTYNTNDVVSKDGTAYLALTTTDDEPPSADWMELGAKGDTGDTGAQGIQGIQGEQGVQGIQGIQGVKGDTGSGIQPDASGTFGGRDTYDGEAKDFVYLQTDVSPFRLWIKASASSGDWAGPTYIGGAAAIADLGSVTDSVLETFDYGEVA